MGSPIDYVIDVRGIKNHIPLNTGFHPLEFSRTHTLEESTRAFLYIAAGILSALTIVIINRSCLILAEPYTLPITRDRIRSLPRARTESAPAALLQPTLPPRPLFSFGNSHRYLMPQTHSTRALNLPSDQRQHPITPVHLQARDPNIAGKLQISTLQHDKVRYSIRPGSVSKILGHRLLPLRLLCVVHEKGHRRLTRRLLICWIT